MSIANLFTNNYDNIHCDNLIVDGTTSFTGDIGITGTLSAVGNISTTSTNANSINTAGGIQVAGNGTFNNVTVANTLNCQTLTYENTEIVQSTTDATGLNTGAFQDAGGASINKSLYVGSTINALNTDPNNSIICNGGASFNNNVNAS